MLVYILEEQAVKDSTRRKITLTGGALALASLGFAAAKAAKRGTHIEVEQDFSVPAKDVIDLIKQVEREPEFVPFVSRVEVLERQENEVTYRVDLTPPMLINVIYRKWWNYEEGWVAWQSQAGTFGLSHTGEIRFTDTPTGCRARLTTDYKFYTPFLGGAANVTSGPFVQGAMSGWLKRLAANFGGNA